MLFAFDHVQTVLTTYQVMVIEMKNENSVLDLIHWHRLIVVRALSSFRILFIAWFSAKYIMLRGIMQDEAHCLKNNTTKQVKYMQRLYATKCVPISTQPSR